jgi:enoyl-CoA hydratase/carnithine racemase
MFNEYRNKYENVKMKREDGILEVALHTRGGPLVFNGYVHEALVNAFRDIGDDRENHVVILTGTGDEFCAQITGDGFDFFTPSGTTRSCERAQRFLKTFSIYRSR